MCIFFLESPAENLCVPDNSRHGSDGLVHPFDHVHNGVTNGFGLQPQADSSDTEVQEIFGNSAGTAAVQVLVEMNGEEDSSNTDAGILAIYPYPP